jgi:hypothetical protein
MIKKAPTAGRLLPTLICAWCKGVMRHGASKVSHGICKPCATHWFGKLRPNGTPQPA